VFGGKKQLDSACLFRKGAEIKALLRLSKKAPQENKESCHPDHAEIVCPQKGFSMRLGRSIQHRRGERGKTGERVA